MNNITMFLEFCCFHDVYLLPYLIVNSYGDIPAHNLLWRECEKSAGDVSARLAMIPMVQVVSCFKRLASIFLHHIGHDNQDKNASLYTYPTNRSKLAFVRLNHQ